MTDPRPQDGADRNDGREARPASASQVPLPQVPVPQPAPQAGQRPAPALSADGRPVGRPAPQYGEYAPDGWVNPVVADRERREQEAAARRRELAASEAARVQQRRSVPPVRNPADRSTGPAAPDARPSSTGAPTAHRTRFGASAGDVMATVLLLAFGLTTVLQQVIGVGRVASQVAEQIAQRYVPLADPTALVPAAAWSAIVGAVVFVGALWWSIVRLRSRKTTFWVPLAAGAFAGVFSTILYVAVIMHDSAFVCYVLSNGGSV
jgi:hypothetical protein